MIYLGADHRGYELKEKIKKWLFEWGYKYEDMGAFEYDKDDDYPDFATATAKAVALSLPKGSNQLKGESSRGILICGSGIGIAVAANKIKGIRAGTGTGTKQIISAVNDEDLNILALPADYISENEAKEIVKSFLEAKFSGEERHARRINKITNLENESQ